jgi:hypothetical protein
MKIKQIIVAFFFATVVASCGSKPADINVAELETACDHVNASLEVTNEVVELMENNKSKADADISQDEKETFLAALFRKLEEIDLAMSTKEFSIADQEKCPSFEKLSEARMKMAF